MKISDAVVSGIEILFYVFHLSLLIVLIAERKNNFSGAFYNMLRLLFISDIAFFVGSFPSRLPAFGFWREFFETDAIVAKIQVITVGYLIGVQFLIHAFIPFNRFTLFWFPSFYKRIWERQWYTIVILVFPIIMQIPWMLEPAAFIFSRIGTVVLTFTNPSSTTSSLYLILIFSCLMTVFAAIFNLLAILKHFINKCTSKNLIQLKEITFLYMSCILFLIHCLYCAIIVGRTFYSENPIIAFLFQVFQVFVIDIIAWSESITLLFMSKYARKIYVNFYRNLIRQQKTTPVVSFKASAASKTKTQLTRIT